MERSIAEFISNVNKIQSSDIHVDTLDVQNQNELLMNQLLNYQHVTGPGERSLKEIQYGISIHSLEAMYRDLTKREKEVLLYLYYYFNKFAGKIKIPIKNLMDHFSLSKSWVLEVLASLRDKRYIVKTGGGVGGYVSRRTFTDLGCLLVKVLKKGFKHVVNRFTGPFSGPTPIISTKITISQEENLPFAPILENLKKNDSPFEVQKYIDAMKSIVRKRDG